jgi:hypothetical protein
MAITTWCPGCKKRIEAPDKAAGHKAKCPRCGEVVPIPASSEEAPESPAGAAARAVAALGRSATPSPQSRTSVTTIERLAARTSPYGRLRVMGTLIFALGIVLGVIIFLLGLAALILVSMRGWPLAGVGVFVAGLLVAGVLFLAAKVAADFIRLGADLGDRTRQIALYLEETARQDDEAV